MVKNQQPVKNQLMPRRVRKALCLVHNIPFVPITYYAGNGRRVMPVFSELYRNGVVVGHQKALKPLEPVNPRFMHAV